jgi:hypothetical protein
MQRVQETDQARMPHPPRFGASFRSPKTTRVEQQISSRLVLTKLDEAAMRRYQGDMANNQLFFEATGTNYCPASIGH